MLTELVVRNARAKDKDYKLADSEGLYLYVTKSGHRSWRLKCRFAGKERQLVLGGCPDLPLKVARDWKIAARKMLADGRDPGLGAQRAKVERAVVAGNTFEALARVWYDLQESRWTPIHAGDVIGSLEKEVFPWIGKLPIREIDKTLVLSVLRKIEKRGAIETAHRVRQRMSAVFVHAIAEGAAARDPASVVTKALKPVPRARKRPALVSLEALHDMIRKTEAEPALPLTKLASRFVALTAQRPGMIRALPWAEIENVDWTSEATCPDARSRLHRALRMAGIDHVAAEQPVSDQARAEVLHAVPFYLELEERAVLAQRGVGSLVDPCQEAGVESEGEAEVDDAKEVVVRQWADCPLSVGRVLPAVVQDAPLDHPLRTIERDRIGIAQIGTRLDQLDEPVLRRRIWNDIGDLGNREVAAHLLDFVQLVECDQVADAGTHAGQVLAGELVPLGRAFVVARIGAVNENALGYGASLFPLFE